MIPLHQKSLQKRQVYDNSDNSAPVVWDYEQALQQALQQAWQQALNRLSLRLFEF